jgi:glycyl-tRNA synthetase
MEKVLSEDIVSLCKRRGFIFQGSEIYGGLAGTWDYGPLGVALKRNITNLWWKMFVEDRDDMYGIDAAILMNQKVWQASGHATGFNDPLVECSECKTRLRADHIENDKCPNCGKTGKFSEPRQFNMMFKTSVGPVEDESSVSYLRPETAQGMFTNFKNVVDSIYPDFPFGMAQIGKAFRNEISPRDFIFRGREFEQMEIEYFVTEEGWEARFEDWKNKFYKWFEAIGLPKSMVHELDVPESDRAHYSKKTIDFEFDFPFGKSELYGLAYRTDFDLKNHEKSSGKKLVYVPKEGGQPFTPHVIEPTFGVDRTILAVLTACYKEDEVNGERRSYLALPDALAPVKYVVSPLVKNKPELVKKAREVYSLVKKKYGAVLWDDNANVGKRYRRADEIGVPKCITIDFQTLEDDTVTVRDRDTTEQVRKSVSEI